MRKKGILHIILFVTSVGISAAAFADKGNDTINIQELYNGRAWKNIYYRIKGDQFLFTPDLLKGAVSINNQDYRNLRLRYDIYNDELITINHHGILIQMNKEMIDNFSLEYRNQVYRFRKFDADSSASIKGFVNILYEGKSALYIKYFKEILTLAVENKYDLFNQVFRVYLVKDGKVYRINSKMELLRLLKDKKSEIHHFIRSNKLKVSKKNPESFAPVIEFYDNLQH